MEDLTSDAKVGGVCVLEHRYLLISEEKFEVLKYGYYYVC